jgi:hypothetical protein
VEKGGWYCYSEKLGLVDSMQGGDLRILNK